MIDETAYKRILETIERAKSEATLAYQAKNVPNEGYFVPPTIFTDVKPDRAHRAAKKSSARS